MIDLALQRVGPDDAKRSLEFSNLKEEITSALDKDSEQRQKKASRTFYHFGKLPLELAMTIFSYILEDDPAFVVILAQVNRAWRSVILNTPELWNTLVLTQKDPLRKARIWKERCGDRLKSLDIRTCDMKTIWALNELYSVPLGHLRVLALRDVRTDHFLKMLPACTPVVLQNLEHLRLQSLAIQQDVLRLTGEPILHLRTLVARNTAVHWPNLASNCSSLQTIVFEDCLERKYLNDFLWLLHSNPQLETLELMFAGLISTRLECPSVPRTLPERIVLPNLTKLSVGGGVMEISPTQIVTITSFPSLHTLHLIRIVGYLDPILEHLLEDGSVPGLREVKIESCVARSDAPLLRLVEVATELQSLQISQLPRANPLLEMLATPTTSSEGSEPIMHSPKLSRLEVTHCPDVKTGPIVRLIKLRNSPDATSSRISTLVLDGCGIDAEVVPWLRQQVSVVSCIYQTKKEAKKWRR